MQKPSKPVGILLTRPLASSLGMAQRFQERGVTPYIAPLLQIQPIPFAKTLAPDIAAILLTSQHALKGLKGISKNCPLVVVGDTTAKMARAGGFKNVTCGGITASKLADYVQQRYAVSMNFFYASGDVTAYPLKENLEQKNFRVQQEILYKSIPSPYFSPDIVAGFQKKSFRFVALFSKRSARIFQALVHTAGLEDALTDITCIAYSRQVQETVSALPWKKLATCDIPTTTSFWIFADQHIFQYTDESHKD